MQTANSCQCFHHGMSLLQYTPLAMHVASINASTECAWIVAHSQACFATGYFQTHLHR